jgi:hypothetical protein
MNYYEGKTETGIEPNIYRSIPAMTYSFRMPVIIT